MTALLLSKLDAIYFSCLIAKTMLNISGESGHPCLVPYPKGKALRFSQGLLHMIFIMLRYVSSIHILRNFTINECFILSFYSIKFRKDAWYDLNLLDWDLLYGPAYGLSWRIFQVQFKRMCILLAGMIYFIGIFILLLWLKTEPVISLRYTYRFSSSCFKILFLSLIFDILIWVCFGYGSLWLILFGIL